MSFLPFPHHLFSVAFTTKLQAAAAAAKSLQSCPTLCDPIDGSPLGSSVPGILQARILEWVAISFSNAWKWKVKVKSLSHAWLLATPWTAASQAPRSMGFSRQEYWSGVPLPSPGKLQATQPQNGITTWNEVRRGVMDFIDQIKAATEPTCAWCLSLLWTWMPISTCWTCVDLLDTIWLHLSPPYVENSGLLCLCRGIQLSVCLENWHIKRRKKILNRH